MATDWSREEVEATIASYLEMLRLELAGLPYNKTEFRRHLSRLLDGRTDGAIERKHQNISAVMIGLGLPYIIGYKPLSNYQELLADIVAERVEGDRTLVTTIAQEVVAPAAVPSADDILERLVAPPERSKKERPPQLRSAPHARVVNYLEVEARNASLGAAGEEFVMRYEVARLIAERAERLAGKVERVSATRGDGLGYDVLSFDRTGAERLIEVKTTRYGASTPFFVSRNELNVSRDQASRYHLYRVFGFRETPKFYRKAGQIDREFAIDPVVWEARTA
jgi:hypothetical protein